MRAACFYLFLFTLLYKPSSAQTVTEIFGVVTDATTKEPMSYVNVRVYGGVPKATMTDPKGEYRIRTAEKIDSVTFSSLGYKTRSIQVKRGGVQELNVEMGSDDLVLKEVTVKAGKRRKREIDTTANYVFYQVLKHKSENRANNIVSYQYESYERLQISLLNPSEKFQNFVLWKPFRFAFENKDTTDDGSMFIPGLIRETVSDVYYRTHPRKQLKTIIKAEKMTGVDNPSINNLAAFEFQEIDPYENQYYLARTFFPAPFAPTSMGLYFYYLTDTVQIEGRISYKLHFVGRVKEDQALKGYAWIDSATWGIRSIEFKPNEKANLNFINEFDTRIEFEWVDGKYWLKSREEMQSVGSLFKKKNKLGILVNKLVEKRGFQTNILFPDSVFIGLEERVLLDSARKRDKAYWDTTRFAPLSRSQERVYVISDTIKEVKAWKTYMWLGKFFTSAFANAGPISIGRVLNFASRNNVEGWRFRFGFETNPQFRRGTPAYYFLRQFYFTGYVAYGLKDRDFKQMALIRINLPRKNDRWQSMEAMYRYDMRVPGQDEVLTPLTFDNIVTLISGRTLSKIMKVREMRFTYEKEWLRGFSTVAIFNDKVYFEVPGAFNFSKRVNDVIVRVPNFGVTEFTLDSRYSYKDLYVTGIFYRFFQYTKHPAFMLRYNLGLVNILQEHFEYHNLTFTIKHRLASVIGRTHYSFVAGKMFGKAPYTACYITQGNLGILLDKFNYNLLREFEFISDQYAQLWIEHHFNGFFFNKIPGFNKLRLREVIIFKSLIGSFSQRNADVLIIPSELRAPGPVPYIELGFGISNIAYMFRVDFLWRATYRNTGGQNWGVKLAFQPQF